MKKIIMSIFALVFLFVGTSAFAATWNDGSQGPECPDINISSNGNGSGNPCWTGVNINTTPGSTVRVKVYYHNTGGVTANNTKIKLNAPSGSSANLSFTGQILSNQGNLYTSPVSANVSPAQTVTFSSVVWYTKNASGTLVATPLLNGQSGSEIISQGLNIGNIAPGWSTQGAVVADFIVSNSQPQTCKINTFTASPSTITLGGSSTLSWSTSNCDSAMITSSNNSFNYNIPYFNVLNGSTSVSPTGNTTYTITGYGPNGSTHTKTTTVSVNTPISNCTISSFTASPAQIISGDFSVISWSTTDCTSVSITPNIGNVGASGSRNVFPTVNTTYTITGYGANGSTDTDTVTVNVNNPINNCVINNFTASPSQITSGGFSTLSWNTTDCTSVTISNLGYNVPTSGSQVIYPTHTTTYTLTAYGQNGSPVTLSRTVSVTAASACVVNNFYANPNSINTGGSSTLIWDTTDCTSVSITPNIGNVGASGSRNVYPTQTTTYTLTAYGINGTQQTKYETITVQQAQNCFINNFSANPNSINTGGSSTLTWNTSNCTSVNISNLNYNVPVSGSQVVYPTYTTTYVLTAYGANGGQQTQSVTVFVNNNYQNNCSISYFNASPTQINTGGTSTLNWSTTNCNNVTISNLGYNVPTSGTQVVYPTYTTTYVLTAYGQNGVQQTQSTQVHVNTYVPPVVTSCAVSTISTNVNQNSATLNGMLTGGGSYNTYFEYGPTMSLGFQTPARSSNGSSAFSDIIVGLSPETVYYFRLVSNCQNGSISRGDFKVFQTLSPNVKPVIIQGTTVVGTGSPVMLKIENRFSSIRTGDIINYIVTYKNIGTKKLTRPIVQVVIPDSITFLNSSRGTYSENSRTLNVPIEDLNPGNEGVIYLEGRVDSIKSNNREIVTTAILVYTNSKNAQENAIAYVLNNEVYYGENNNNNNSLGALAFFSGFFGIGLIGWLLIIIIILLIVLIYRRYFHQKSFSSTDTITNTKIDTHSTH